MGETACTLLETSPLPQKKLLESSIQLVPENIDHEHKSAWDRVLFISHNRKSLIMVVNTLMTVSILME